jgi:hypothetical protein
MKILVGQNFRMFGNHLSATSKYNEDTNLFKHIENVVRV